jgi:hypothetical protein
LAQSLLGVGLFCQRQADRALTALVERPQRPGSRSPDHCDRRRSDGNAMMKN